MKSNISNNKQSKYPASIADFALNELAENVIEFKSYLSQKSVIEFSTKLVNSSHDDQIEFLGKIFNSKKSIKHLYEKFFPDTARFLGNQWAQDLLSFSKVSVGIANLQILLKKYDHLYLENMMVYKDVPNILLLTPPKETHTFGSLMAYRIFKNLGCNPLLLANPSVKEIEKILEVNSFSLIGISLADFTLIDEVKKLIALIRTITPVNCPIILGGEIENWTSNCPRIPGLDAINSKPKEILEMCELTPESNLLIPNKNVLKNF